MVTFLSGPRGIGWNGVLVAVVASFALGGASCGGGGGGGGGIRCVADSVCQPACADDPDCVSSGRGGQSAGGGGGTAAGSAGSPGTAGASGASGVSGNAGTGGAGQTCGPPTVAGQVSFTGVSDIAFTAVTPNVQHKRDIDQFEDGCFNQLDFTFGYAAGCTLHIVASDCLDAQGRMKVQSITFTADSQCPNFPDATEGMYTGGATAVDGSWIAMSMPGITERDVAMSCTGGQFTISLAGSLTASGSRKLTLGPTSTLIVMGMFQSTAREAACPGQCATGAGGSSGAGGTGGAGGSGGASGSGGSGATAGAGGTGGASGVGASGGASGRGGTGGTGGTASGGRGGSSGSSGGAGTGGTGAAGGAGGTEGPCAGLCSNPIVVQPNTNGGDLGTAATCQSVAGSSGSLVCGNFMAPRTFTVNSTAVDCSSGVFALPAPRNGGWCMQATAGNYSYAYFSTLNVR
jgi:hypothetical protein